MLGWTQTLWRVFCRDVTVKCAYKSAMLLYFGTTLHAILKPCRQASQISNLNTESCFFGYVVSCFEEGNTASQVIEDVIILKAITWLQTTWKSVSTEIIKQYFKKYEFGVGDMSIINEKIDTEFSELFAQIPSETTLDEYIDFDEETITSEPAVDPTHVDW